jgi:hypothetical protein
VPELPLPNASDLSYVLSQVLEDYAFAFAVPGEGDAALDLSVRAQLPGGQAWLALRGSQALAQRLAADAAGPEEAEDPALAEDAFLELCNLAVSHLSSRLGTDHGGYKPFVPARGLPDGRCLSRARLSVDGEPLEASIWSAA